MMMAKVRATCCYYIFFVAADANWRNKFQVYCVQMTIMMGYDVLFQDVDVVWYKNPLPFFQDKSSAMYNFDVYFQDDGSRQLFYSPYSANTGKIARFADALIYPCGT